MVHSDKILVPAATTNKRLSAALRQLNTIEDVLIAAEGKVQVIDGQIQAVTGNQQPRTNMAMANMVATFPPSHHFQPPFHFNSGVPSMMNKPQTLPSSTFTLESRAHTPQHTHQNRAGLQDLANQLKTWTSLQYFTQQLATRTQQPGWSRKPCWMLQFSSALLNPPSPEQQQEPPHPQNAGDATASRTFTNTDSICSKTVPTKREKT
jgi:hypothetical protein